MKNTFDKEKQQESRTDPTDIYLEQKRQQNALREALRIAEEANRMKNLFFLNMSHDIRTPMNAIIGFATLLEQAASDEEQVRIYTRKILNSSKLLLSLINEVLDISLIESGKAVLNNSLIHIEALVNEMDSMIRPQTLARKQEFHIQIGELAHQYVTGDDIRITQILMNILNNAVKYTPEGGCIDFTVCGVPHSPEADKITFTVKDTGIGISREFIKNIFEPFSREQNKIVDKIQGTGLGMAITKSLVDLLDGEIIVDSEPGKGSTFTVIFYLRISEERAESGEAAGERHQSQKTAEENVAIAEAKPFKGIRILAAEDNELNAELLSKLLQMAGAECKIASNGLEAVNRFQEEPEDYDLILMDVRMPVMDGCEAARTIRNLACGKAKTIPIIALTANAFTEDTSMVLEAGMNAHLTKPVDTAKLYKTIREYV
ncbi:ATP-binding protein [Blautia schinkii]|nr:ATP-binding protein [Blautia schinkii]